MSSNVASSAIQLYMDTFSERELRGYAIAKSHLGHSFKIEKSVGFQKWKKENNDQTAATEAPKISAVDVSAAAAVK